jgi:hypothetical protein
MATLVRTVTIGLVLLAGVLSVSTTRAADPADNVSIPFADLGNIRNWHAESAEVLYVQSAKRDWYRITFWAPCLALPFATGIAFVTDGTSSLDKYSSILVDGENCKFRTFEASPAPPAEAEAGDEPDQ